MTMTETTAQVSTEDLLARAMTENAQLHRRVEHYTALSASLGALVRELEAKVIDKDREIETLRRAAVRAVWQTSLRKGGTNVEPLAPRPPRAQTRGTDEEGGAV